MAKDWTSDATIDRINKRTSAGLPENLAPIPIALALQDEGDGFQWYVDLMLRTPEFEIDVTSAHPQLREALRNAYTRFCRSHTYYLNYGMLPD